MIADLLPLAILGAVLGLDVVSFPQAMISRPLVAATAAGALLGHPASGLIAGATLEFFALETLPFGASRYPEWGSASVVGGALFATHPLETPGGMAVAVAGALATAWTGGWSMFFLRRLNARLARRRLAALARGSRKTVIGLQVAGLTFDLVRGGALTLAALLILQPVADLAVDRWSVDQRFSRAVVVGVAASVAAGAVWKIFHSTAGARWYFLAGLAAGLALVAIDIGR